MLRGFAAGSLLLIALYVGLQPNAANAAQTGSNVLVQGLRRLLSGDVAGVPSRGAKKDTKAAAATVADTNITRSVAPAVQAAFDRVQQVTGGGS